MRGRKVEGGRRVSRTYSRQTILVGKACQLCARSRGFLGIRAVGWGGKLSGLPGRIVGRSANLPADEAAHIDEESKRHRAPNLTGILPSSLPLHKGHADAQLGGDGYDGHPHQLAAPFPK